MNELIYDSARRMCDSYEKCSDCPVNPMLLPNSETVCFISAMGYAVDPLGQREVLYEWVREHPYVKTYLEDYCERFPNAKSCRNFLYVGCPRIIYHGTRYDCLTCKFGETEECEKCWKSPLGSLDPIKEDLDGTASDKYNGETR